MNIRQSQIFPLEMFLWKDPDHNCKHGREARATTRLCIFQKPIAEARIQIDLGCSELRSLMPIGLHIRQALPQRYFLRESIQKILYPTRSLFPITLCLYRCEQICDCPRQTQQDTRCCIPLQSETESRIPTQSCQAQVLRDMRHSPREIAYAATRDAL